MALKDFQTKYIAGIDASNLDTIPDTSLTHPMNFIDPPQDYDDFLEGLAIGRRYTMNMMDWLLLRKWMQIKFTYPMTQFIIW